MQVCSKHTCTLEPFPSTFATIIWQRKQVKEKKKRYYQYARFARSMYSRVTCHLSSTPHATRVACSAQVGVNILHCWQL